MKASGHCSKSQPPAQAAGIEKPPPNKKGQLNGGQSQIPHRRGAKAAPRNSACPFWERLTWTVVLAWCRTWAISEPLPDSKSIIANLRCSRLRLVEQVARPPR